MDYSDILYQRKDGIATVTINRPAKHNALRLATFRELIDALEEAAKDESVGVVVLTGSGAKAFCAGGDLGMARDELRTLHDMRTHHIERMLRISALITPAAAESEGRRPKLKLGSSLIAMSDSRRNTCSPL